MLLHLWPFARWSEPTERDSAWTWTRKPIIQRFPVLMQVSMHGQDSVTGASLELNSFPSDRGPLTTQTTAAAVQNRWHPRALCPVSQSSKCPVSPLRQQVWLVSLGSVTQEASLTVQFYTLWSQFATTGQSPQLVTFTVYNHRRANSV